MLKDRILLDDVFSRFFFVLLFSNRDEPKLPEWIKKKRKCRFFDDDDRDILLFYTLSATRYCYYFRAISWGTTPRLRVLTHNWILTFNTHVGIYVYMVRALRTRFVPTIISCLYYYKYTKVKNTNNNNKRLWWCRVKIENEKKRQAVVSETRAGLRYPRRWRTETFVCTKTRVSASKCFRLDQTFENKSF